MTTSASDSAFLAAIQGPTFGEPIRRSKEDGRLYTYDPDSGTWQWEDGTGIQERISILTGDDFSASKKRAVVNLAAHMRPTMEASGAATRGLINVKNGVVNLTTHPDPTLEPFSPAHFFRYSIPHNYNPAATCPNIDAALADMFDPDMVDLFHEIIGYVLLPGLNLKKAIHFYSRETGTSKSTWLNVIGAVVGRENTTGISLQDLDDHRFHRASLQGKLLNSAGEIGSAAPKSSAVFKALVGGDPVPAEHKGDRMFMLQNTATMLFAGNMFANTHEQGDAYTSRWMIVPFTKQYRVDPNFYKTVSTPDELEGLLAHAVRGAARLLSRGGFPNPLPYQVELAASKMCLDLDSVARFAEECLVIAGDGELDGAATYNTYRSWAEDAGLRSVGRPQFYLRMADRPGVKVVEGRARMKKIIGATVAFPVVSNSPEWRK